MRVVECYTAVPRTTEKKRSADKRFGGSAVSGGWGVYTYYSYGHIYFPTGLSDKLINMLGCSRDLFVAKKNKKIFKYLK